MACPVGWRHTTCSRHGSPKNSTCGQPEPPQLSSAYPRGLIECKERPDWSHWVKRPARWCTGTPWYTQTDTQEPPYTQPSHTQGHITPMSRGKRSHGTDIKAWAHIPAG